MITYPNCKINLGLNIVEKRPDGYHNLETLFIPIPLCDVLEMEPSSEFSFCQEGITLDNIPEDNLCVKAFRLLQRDFPQQVGPVRMRLEKRIPFGAGLGGGSSDAAFTLKMLRELYDLPLSDRQLERYASSLGADCAFFIRNQAAYATGIGEILEPISLDLSQYRIALFKPSDHVPTREAYAGIIPRPSSHDLRESVRKPIFQWRDLIVNDFEHSVFPNHPRIAQIKSSLYEQGALYASMTGSGAAVFGFFSKDADIALTDDVVFVG